MEETNAGGPVQTAGNGEGIVYHTSGRIFDRLMGKLNPETASRNRLNCNLVSSLPGIKPLARPMTSIPQCGTPSQAPASTFALPVKMKTLLAALASYVQPAAPFCFLGLLTSQSITGGPCGRGVHPHRHAAMQDRHSGEGVPAVRPAEGALHADAPAHDRHRPGGGVRDGDRDGGVRGVGL